MTNKSKGKSKIAVEFFVLNLSVLPPAENTESYYSNIIEKWFENQFKIEIGNDFYYSLFHLSKASSGSNTIYYGIISKFLRLDTIDWVKDTEVEEVEEETDFVLPSNLKGRKGMYEFIFIPSKHKVAFIKKGKINEEIKRRGAPLKAIKDVFKEAVTQIVADNKNVYVDVVQDKQIFEKIYDSNILNLNMQLHYSNPDIDEELEEYMDELYKETKAAKLNITMSADKNTPISPDSKFVHGSLQIARKNGSVRANIEYEGVKEKINTKDYPEIGTVELESTREDRYSAFLQKIGKYFLNNESE